MNLQYTNIYKHVFKAYRYMYSTQWNGSWLVSKVMFYATVSTSDYKIASSRIFFKYIKNYPNKFDQKTEDFHGNDFSVPLQYCTKVMQVKCMNFVLCRCEFSLKNHAIFQGNNQCVSSSNSLEQQGKFHYTIVFLNHGDDMVPETIVTSNHEILGLVK